MTLSAFKYFGGKSGNAATGNGRWVASLLPTDARWYVEPFAGMLGVLLQRRRAPHEVANDADMRIVHWWRMVRDRNGELVQAVANTPFSEAEYARCYQQACDGFDGVGSRPTLTLPTVPPRRRQHR